LSFLWSPISQTPPPPLLPFAPLPLREEEAWSQAGEEQYYEEEPAAYEEGYEERGGYEEAGGYEEEAVAEAYEEQGYEEEAYGGAEAGYGEEEAAGYEEEGGWAEEGSGEGLGQVRGTFDFEAQNEGDLSFVTGDIITVLDNSDPDGWWLGELNGLQGLFPSNYTEPV
jgi:hypothetical protein